MAGHEMLPILVQYQYSILHIATFSVSAFAGKVRLGKVIGACHGKDTGHAPESLFNPCRQSLELARAFQGVMTPIT
ncbi:hypothetical protein [Acidithiobacillus sp. IBUN Pt1247-S3]|uniref:hypothetical protein n=1 Tax=Acidithiobacillus sp. IBUN Pt1247-S3 TaxID=3166642 RepID=UPI0034E5C7F7